MDATNFEGGLSFIDRGYLNHTVVGIVKSIFSDSYVSKSNNATVTQEKIVVECGNEQYSQPVVFVLSNYVLTYYKDKLHTLIGAEVGLVFRINGIEWFDSKNNTTRYIMNHNINKMFILQEAYTPETLNNDLLNQRVNPIVFDSEPKSPDMLRNCIDEFIKNVKYFKQVMADRCVSLNELPAHTFVGFEMVQKEIQMFNDYEYVEPNQPNYYTPMDDEHDDLPF